MCNKGIIACDSCAGRGFVEEGRMCPHCDGLGTSACGFCRGTGWADPDLVPSELQEVVGFRKLAHVRKDLKLLTRMFRNTPPERLGAMDQRTRKDLALRLMRTQARLRVMAESAQEGDADERVELLEAADRIEAYLQALGVSTAPEPEEQEDEPEPAPPEADAEGPAGDEGEYSLA
jgi:hypothetical protein